MLKIIWLFSFLSMMAYATDYSDAMNHAKDAFLEQSGANNLMQQTGNYLKNTYVQPYPWLRDTGAVGYGAYYTYRHKSLPGMALTKNCKLTLSWEAARIEYHF